MQSALYAAVCSGTPIVITSIDSVFVNSAWLKRWNTDMNSFGCIISPELFIEGIGSVYGILNLYLGFESLHTLSCISAADTLYYINPNFSGTCDLVTSLAETGIC